jgi:hypothetical protein
MLPEAQFRAMGEGLHEHYPLGDPHWVPIEQRYSTDAEDPNSVADPNGADLSDVDPDAGPELIDPRLFR